VRTGSDQNTPQAAHHNNITRVYVSLAVEICVLHTLSSSQSIGGKKYKLITGKSYRPIKTSIIRICARTSISFVLWGHHVQ
jgi:hypothetical protein